MDYQLLSRPQVTEMTGLVTTSIYRMMREGKFPLPLKLSPQCVRWRSDEITAWAESRERATGEFPGVKTVEKKGGVYASAA